MIGFCCGRPVYKINLNHVMLLQPGINNALGSASNSCLLEEHCHLGAAAEHCAVADGD